MTGDLTNIHSGPSLQSESIIWEKTSGFYERDTPIHISDMFTNYLMVN